MDRREAQHRVQRIQSLMQEASVDAAFIMQNADVYYFSGTIQSGLLCLPCTGEPVHLVGKSLTRARQESPWERIMPLNRLEDAPRLLEQEISGRLKKVGLEMDVLPAANYLRLKELFPGVEFIDASPAIRKIRMIKSPYEIEQIRKAADMLLRAWQKMPEWIRPGASELEVLAQLECYLRLQGHQGIQRTRGFNYEIGYGAFSSGTNANYPTSFPGATGFSGLYPAVSNSGSKHRLAPGDPLIVDIAGAYGGYLADAARTYVIGDIASDMRRAHELILELNGEIESMLKPGTECRQLYNHALDKMKGSPYADTFLGAGENHVRFLGHGVGLELDELPVLNAHSDIKLEPGMTIAVDPKIFFPERGGVGIENMYAITGTGFEKLTPFREDIIAVKPS
jgi:Xaa-Pro dipeptidase